MNTDTKQETSFYDKIKTMSLEELTGLKEKMDDIYYNTGDKPELTDFEYDILNEYINHNGNQMIGCKIRDDIVKNKLPVGMTSMDKASTDLQLTTWVGKNKTLDDWMVEVKLDGVSCLVTSDEDSNVKMYTRGDGICGTDITHLREYISSLPREISPDVVVRGELIIKKKTFETKWESEFSNSRNLVSGCVNAKTLRPAVFDIDFVAYEIIKSDVCDRPLTQLEQIFEEGFIPVDNRIVSPDDMDFENAKELLNEMKVSSEYEMDGVIIRPNTSYVHDQLKNPKNAIAFKQQHQDNIATTSVVRVLWAASKWGLMKPRVEIEPVHLAGVTISFVTCYNARYIVDNLINVGTVLTVTRSGDVIPKILTILEPSYSVDLPSGCSWNTTLIDLVVDEIGDESNIKTIHSFFSKLGCKHLGEKIVAKLYNAGHKSMFEFMDFTVAQMLEVDGIAEKGAVRIHEQLHSAVEKASMPLLVASSGVLGFGFSSKKTDLLFGEIPEFYTYDDMDLLQSKITSIKGFSPGSAELITSKFHESLDFLNQVNERRITKFQIITSTVDVSVKPCINITFSGFRLSAEIQSELDTLNVTIDNTITKKTKYLITKDNCLKVSSKVTKARQLDIPIITETELLEMFNISK